jgi:menaquinone-dependent protoporphyrinogen oxidase
LHPEIENLFTRMMIMDSKILVAYATSSGSTQEIAEVVGEELRKNGLAVDVQPMRNIRSLDGYSAFLLGIPLYMFRWHRDARRFLSRQRKNLSGELPIAIFSGGLFETGDEKELHEDKDVRAQVDKELAKYPWLKPVSIEIVGGRFDPQKLAFPWKLLPALRQLPASDLRDWDLIRTWASNLAGRFKSTSA